MPCKTCTKSKDIKLNRLNQKKSYDVLKNPVMFESKIGRFLYFLLLACVALTPIINLVMLYMFYKAVYGKSKEKEENQMKDAQINQNQSNTQ